MRQFYGAKVIVMQHPLQILLQTKNAGPVGLPSVCSANEWVIDAGMDWALANDLPLLLEATANQVNQFGGYTGMTPDDFRHFVQTRAEARGFPLDRLILGGDHLGPLVWRGEPEASAMDKAEALVSAFVMAGFTKIHLDTSMPLSGDVISHGLDPALVAARGARLARACESALAERRRTHPDCPSPVYVVGSEVPIPGGAQEEEEAIVTSPSRFLETVSLFQAAFEELGLQDAWSRVLAVVVQPGVEFGNDSILDYDPEAARALCEALRAYPALCFEGHSTDYQRPASLRAMMRDGISILKVGPALTFVLREGLFALAYMEKTLYADAPERQSRFIEVLEETMVKNPVYWKPYFHGGDAVLSLHRKFGLSDRCRYYLGQPEVRAAEQTLLQNMRETEIPLGLLHQFLPVQYEKVRQGVLANEPGSLLLDKVRTLLDDYRTTGGAERETQ